jgi:hypothetical protein
VSRLARLRLFTALAAGLVCASSASAAGRVVGHIDGTGYDGAQPYVSGWACQLGESRSIVVQLYADHSPGDAPKGAIVAIGQADLDSDPGVKQACQDQLGKHRFKIALPTQASLKAGERKLFALGLPVPGAIPALSGAYTSSATHPRIFTTRGELADLTRRVGVPGSYSAKRFDQLAGQIGRDLAAHNDWRATYSGCNATVYQYAFSYEPQDGHAAEVHAALQLSPGATAPAGAAVVASRPALYAALVKAGAVPPAGAPSADQAAVLAKRILLAWAEHGFRDGHGHFLSSPSQFCDENGKPGAGAGSEGLTIARGVIYSAHAQDLLMYVGALDDSGVQQLNAFHAAIYELQRNSQNYNFLEHHTWGCDRYSNHAVNRAAALLALARLLDDRKKFEAALYGRDPSIAVALPWIALFDGAIYGEADTSHSCYFNTGSDSLSSKPFFQTDVVAPGEIDDRYRNAYPAQGIGYPMFTLERLVDAAEALRIAGFDPYGYRGLHKQSLELAIQFYACFAKGAGFGKSVTKDNSASCPNAAQYYGKIVNGVDQLVTISAYRFPGNVSITGVEAAAKVSSAAAEFSLDAIFFGKWRD